MNSVPSVCCHDCGGSCPLNIFIKDGKIVKIEPKDNGLTELRACARGLLYHYRVYAPDRLKYPLKRTGERGKGEFTRTSWEEAYDHIAAEISRIQTAYGPAAILNLSWSGSQGIVHYQSSGRNFFRMLGGETEWWGGASFQGGFFASLATYGKVDTGNDRADLLNSDMIILWGCNPAESILGTETRWFLMQAKEKGRKIVCIDPRYTETAARLSQMWVPIKPGTDTALAVAMAYVILDRKLQDQYFLDTYTIGFDKFKDYVVGYEDGVAKTPQWAEKITGVPTETIEQLALEYATHKPAAIIPGFAPGRSAAGEQYHRATTTLSAMTGNIGISGGATGCLDLCFGASSRQEKTNPINYVDMYTQMPQVPNPVAQGQPLHEYSVNGIRKHTRDKISCTKVWDAILRGKAGGYPSDIKMLFIQGGNALNQMPNCNLGVKALNALEFIVVNDMFLTPTARYADYVLPVTTWTERNDIRLPWLFGHYACYVNKSIEPPGETKTDLEIFTELAERMGIKGYNEKTEDEWVRLIADRLGIPDYDRFKAKGFYKETRETPHVAFQEQIEDIANHPFPTPSGKIEIFSQRIADFNRQSVLPPIPKYVETWEGQSDPLREKYPFQLITPHSRRRIHSQFHNVRWFRNLEPHAVWINASDARLKGIKDGERVRVFNNRGTVLLLAKVTQRIMPGVVAIYQGAWFNPDKDGIDQGGCANVLTRGEHSPAGAFPSNTTLVQVEGLESKK